MHASLDPQSDAVVLRQPCEVAMQTVKYCGERKIAPLPLAASGLKFSDIGQGIHESRYHSDGLYWLTESVQRLRLGDCAANTAIQECKRLNRLAQIVPRRSKKSTLHVIGSLGFPACLTESRFYLPLIGHITNYDDSTVGHVANGPKSHRKSRAILAPHRQIRCRVAHVCVARFYELLFRPCISGAKTPRNQLIRAVHHEPLWEISEQMGNSTIRQSDDPEVIDGQSCIRRGNQRVAGNLGEYIFRCRRAAIHSNRTTHAT